MLRIDQCYSLELAIYALARPVDREAETKFIAEWETRKKEAEAVSRRIGNEFLEKIAQAHINGQIAEQAHLKQERLAAMNAPVKQLIEEFGGQIPEQGAEAYPSRNPITHGLLEALRNGAAVAFGRLGGPQYSKEQIEANRWTGEWEFQLRGNFARGGVPHVEIYDVAVFLREHVSQQEVEREAPLAVAPPAMKNLAVARDQELRGFLKQLGPCSEKDARQRAEERFDARIPRERIRDLRRQVGAKGHGGRPRKGAIKIPPQKPIGGIS